MAKCAGLAAFLIGALLLAAPGAGQAQQQDQPRSLDVPASARWQHAATGLIVPRSLAGLPRTAITDASESELDVSVQFGDAATTLITLYVFRPALWNVPVWFDRVETQVLNRDVYGSAVPSGDPIAFAPPKSTTATALRRVYVPAKAPYKATAVAMIALPQWLVAIRASSTKLGPAELDAALTAAIAELGWPDPASGAAALPVAAPVRPCASPLSFAKKAKMRKPDTNQALLGALFAGVAAEAKANEMPSEQKAEFCREGPPEVALAAYRLLGEDHQGLGYVIALGDAGRTIDVHAGLSVLDDHPGFQVTFNELEKSFVYPEFDKLPAPDRVFEMVQKTNPISSTTIGGKNVDVVIEH